MQICVCGWYYYPSFYETLVKLRGIGGPAAVVIRHQPGDTQGLLCIDRENVGLEWGAYSYYLDKVWDGHSDVLFTQDDIEVFDLSFFGWAATIQEDICFIFNNEGESRYNGTAHGRMFFASSRFLVAATTLGGFWYDKGNHGFIAKGNYRTEKPPPGCSHHNAGIHRFTSFVPKIRKYNTEIKKRAYLCDPRVKLGRRGKF